MAIKPILFNTEMVKAILDGRKTQTRRIIKPQPTNPRWNNIGWLGWDDGHGYRMKPPCEAGDILWVRETWSEMPYGFVYRADDERPEGWEHEDRWFPSIHMQRQAARIFLKVKDVRVERLQEITVLDAINEGCCGTICDHENAYPALGCTDCYNTGWLEPPDAEFAQLWDTTIKPTDLLRYGWEANPWVWVIEFERCEKPGGWC